MSRTDIKLLGVVAVFFIVSCGVIVNYLHGQRPALPDEDLLNQELLMIEERIQQIQRDVIDLRSVDKSWQEAELLAVACGLDFRSREELEDVTSFSGWPGTLSGDGRRVLACFGLMQRVLPVDAIWVEGNGQLLSLGVLVLGVPPGG